MKLRYDGGLSFLSRKAQVAAWVDFPTPAVNTAENAVRARVAINRRDMYSILDAKVLGSRAHPGRKISFAKFSLMLERHI